MTIDRKPGPFFRFVVGSERRRRVLGWLIHRRLIGPVVSRWFLGYRSEVVRMAADNLTRLMSQ